MSQAKRLLGLLWLIPLMVLAAIASSAEIQKAIQDSPHANSWLKANAQAIANLAIRVESGGSTTAYNGSCCYGVLQMNTANISKYAGVTPQEFQQWSLQQQIDAWSQLTVDALKAGSVRQLVEMGTFDGRPVDGHLVLACVQLGIGNCQKMINSGSCSGFADRNGTTICSMADKMAGATTGSGAGSEDNAGSNTGQSGGSWGSAGGGCFGDCSSSAASSVQEGFLQGSGIQMSDLNKNSKTLGAAFVILILAGILTGLWGRYSDGAISTAQLKHYMLKGGVTLGIVLAVMKIL